MGLTFLIPMRPRGELLKAQDAVAGDASGKGSEGKLGKVGTASKLKYLDINEKW